jgi:hypothetical protein
MIVTLHNSQQAHTVLKDLWPKIKETLQAGKQLRLEVKKATRNNEQNRLLHAVLSDIANQVEWSGKKLNANIWKRLCVASWLREKNEKPQLIPALDGNGFDVIYEKTSELTTTQCAELIEWCFAFGSEHGVKFKERDLGQSE